MLSNILCFLVSLALKWHVYKPFHIKPWEAPEPVSLPPVPQAVGAGGLCQERGRGRAPALKTQQRGLADGRSMHQVVSPATTEM